MIHCPDRNRDNAISTAVSASLIAGVLVFIVVFALAGIGRAQQAAPAPAKNAATTQASQSSQSTQSSQSSQSGQHDSQGMAGMPGMQHDGMNMDMDSMANRMANEQMLPGHAHMHMGAHMHMTALRTATPEDWARADAIAAQLREAIEPYKDYHLAIADGFEPFLPNLPQAIYHFTSTRNGFLEAFTFDPARPTSLLYKKTAEGYELIGAMYTMPRDATEEQLNERVPLSVAQWHLHTNLCMPTSAKNADWTKFGLSGSITTQTACSAASGRFFPVIFGWMVHVYPYESTREKVWEQ
jgi:hypothetical protein